MKKAPTMTDEQKRAITPITQGKYTAIIYLNNGEKVYAKELEEDENGVYGRISLYDGSDGGEFEFGKDFVKGIVRK